MKEVSPRLRTLFIIHFVVDVLTAIPLFLIPHTVLGYFNWPSVDPFATRLFAAALFGIGIQSFLGRNAGWEIYKHMLNLKIIWSVSAILGIAYSLWQYPDVRNVLSWTALVTFIVFHGIWVYYRCSQE